MRVLGEYVDAGFSGKNVQGGPQFLQMMDDIIKAQPSKRPVYVLVFKLSRFGRNAADSWDPPSSIISPAYIMAIRSAISSSSDISWVMKMTAKPN